MNLQENAGNPEEHLPLTAPVLQILLALAKTPLHGYGIMKDAASRPGSPPLLPGTLYRALGRLLDGGLIEVVDEAWEEDSRRRCYRLSHLGMRVLKSELRRLETEVQLGRERLARGTLP